MQTKVLKKIAIATLIFLSSLTAQAQKIKVRKVKGQQAVIDFSGGVLVPGQVYKIEDEFSDTPSDSSPSRRYYFDISAGFLNHKSDISGTSSVTQIDVTSTFGWNFQDFEFGPALGYSFTSTGGNSTTSLVVGAYGDWNIIPNLSGEPFTYGMSIFLMTGQETVLDKDLTLVRVQPGLFTKWFLGGSNTGFRVNLAYRYDKYLTSGSSSGSNGIVGTFSIIHYF